MNLLLINDGFASLWWRIIGKKKKLLSYWALPIVREVLNIVEYKCIYSTAILSRWKMKRFIKKHDRKFNTLIIIVKSFGVKEWYDLFCKYMFLYKRIVVICIDGHAPAIFGKPYNETRAFNGFKLKTKCKVYNLFQLDDKKIKGADFINAEENWIVTNTDHFKIIHHKTVLRTIKRVCKYLKKKAVVYSF